MATKRLDFIVSTPVLQRAIVMPHIRCRDGVSFSAQASTYHPNCRPLNNEGPWTAVEVGLLRGAEAPTEWSANSHGRYARPESHNYAEYSEIIDDAGEWPRAVGVGTVEVDGLRAFIEAHGGESET